MWLVCRRVIIGLNLSRFRLLMMNLILTLVWCGLSLMVVTGVRMVPVILLGSLGTVVLIGRVLVLGIWVIRTVLCFGLLGVLGLMMRC